MQTTPKGHFQARPHLGNRVTPQWPKPADGSKIKVFLVRCTKAFAPFRAGQIYYAVQGFRPNRPCNYPGTLQVNVDPDQLGGRCVDASRNCFEPLNPDNRPLFPHLCGPRLVEAAV